MTELAAYKQALTLIIARLEDTIHDPVDDSELVDMVLGVASDVIQDHCDHPFTADDGQAATCDHCGITRKEYLK